MLGQYHVDVAEVVEHLAVELFRHALVKAAVARLHVEHRDLAALGRNDRQAGIGIAVEQQCIGLLQLEHRVGLGDHLGDGLRGGLAGGAEEVVRLADLQVVEEHLVEFVVVVLPRMHQHVVDLAIQLGDHPAHLDQLRTGTDQCHDLKHRAAP
ncbi:hypothetical protein D3C78_1122060 [compost metagenome]